MVWVIILLTVAAVLWIIAGAIGQDQPPAAILCGFFALILTLISCALNYQNITTDYRGKVSDMSPLESGRIYRLVGQIQDKENNNTVFVVDDGNGNRFAVSGDRPFAADVLYFRKESKRANSIDTLSPVAPPPAALPTTAPAAK